MLALWRVRLFPCHVTFVSVADPGEARDPTGYPAAAVQQAGQTPPPGQRYSRWLP